MIPSRFPHGTDYQSVSCSAIDRHDNLHPSSSVKLWPAGGHIVGSAAFAVQARRGEGAWVAVGKRNAGPGVSEFVIPAGTSAARLFYNAPRQDAIINEVIFFSKE